ncbi:hypothetical protein CF651_01945 [Paenibacillus rigui]|uniref:Uncharacterized protein n=2 Tax=Paenibacillus rigui TaxID=554312 RepID=A0A229UWT4_9BACL|nr:hypothetical protein CF651_01945 [Paenibacillus rigui]
MDESHKFYEELRMKYQKEDRARLLMQQLRTFQEVKKHKKWWQKLPLTSKTKTKPISWDIKQS